MKSNTNTVYGMLLELVYLAAMIGLVFLINDLTMFIVAAMGISLVLSVVICRGDDQGGTAASSAYDGAVNKSRNYALGKLGRFQTLCKPGTAFFYLAFCGAVDIENAGCFQVCKRREQRGYKPSACTVFIQEEQSP